MNRISLSSIEVDSKSKNILTELGFSIKNDFYLKHCSLNIPDDWEFELTEWENVSSSIQRNYLISPNSKVKFLFNIANGRKGYIVLVN